MPAHNDSADAPSGPRIVLVRTKDQANVGSVARAMLNFGLRDLWLVAPRCKIDARAYNLATHAAEVLDGATVVGSLAEAVGGLTTVFGTSARPRKAENYTVFSPREAAPKMLADTAVVFGPEDNGLSNEDLTMCQAHIVVPTRDFASLNLAQAVLLVAYEWSQAAAVDQPASAGEASGEPDPRHTPAKREQLEGFYAQLARTMLAIGYTDERRLEGVLRVYRGLIDRAQPSAHETAALRGLMSQTLWATKKRD